VGKLRNKNTKKLKSSISKYLKFISFALILAVYLSLQLDFTQKVIHNFSLHEFEMKLLDLDFKKIFA
jgi:hypothetical protein